MRISHSNSVIIRYGCGEIVEFMYAAARGAEQAAAGGGERQRRAAERNGEQGENRNTWAASIEVEITFAPRWNAKLEYLYAISAKSPPTGRCPAGRSRWSTTRIYAEPGARGCEL